MGIEIRYIGMGDDIFGRSALFAPVVICDACGERISDSAEGVYVWGMARDGSFDTVGLKFFHKGSGRFPNCMAAWRQYEHELDTQGYLHQWIDLSRFVGIMAANLEGNQRGIG